MYWRWATSLKVAGVQVGAGVEVVDGRVVGVVDGAVVIDLVL